VVDLGTGTGYLLPRLSEAVGPTGEVIAADIEPAMLRYVEDAARKEGWSNVRTHRSKPGALDLPAESVDGVVTLNTWHHIDAREAYAKGVLQILRPGGAFVVVDFLAAPTEGFGPPLSIRLTAEQVTAELAAGGFEVEILPETMPRHYMVRGIRRK
jgi:ubiquinone/menaquinone biosynthesis C-methylase UbiE